MSENQETKEKIPQIEITPEMIEAGADAYFEYSVEDLGSERVVCEIYKRMYEARAEMS